MNKNFGYIIGVLKGDGFLDKNSIILNVKDKDFALVFKNKLENEFKKKCRLNRYNGLWRVSLHSRFHSKLLKIYNYKRIAKENNSVKRMFLLGFFDSEGSAYFRKSTGVTDRKVELVNTDIKLLRFCKDLLEELGIKTRKIDKRIRHERKLKGRTLPITVFYRFTLTESKENFIKFRDLVGFSIKRKNKVLNEIISTYLIFRSKWQNLRLQVLQDRNTKSYSELRRKYGFVPVGTLNRWLYSNE